MKSALIKIIRRRDKAEHTLEWRFMRLGGLPIAAGSDKTEWASGFQLVSGQPQRLGIQFIDVDNEPGVSTQIELIRREWWGAQSQAAIPDEEDPSARETRLTQLFESFTHSPTIIDAHGALLRLCYWEAGRYWFQHRVDGEDPDGSFQWDWDFELSAGDSQSLRLNAVNILRAVCGRAQLTPIFIYAKYQNSGGRP